MSREDAPKIERCVFCNSSNVTTEYTTNNTTYSYHVKCYSCGSGGGYFKSSTDAINQWNSVWEIVNEP